MGAQVPVTSMKHNAKPQRINIYDADGTLANPTKVSIREEEFLRDKLVATGVDPSVASGLLRESGKDTLANPFKFPRMYGEFATCFVEDSYMWRGAQLQWLRGYLGDTKAYDVDMYYHGVRDESIVLFPHATELVSKQLSEGEAVVIVTNSSTPKAEKIAALLGHSGEITIYGNAQKFTLNPNFPFEISGHVTYRDRPNYWAILKQILSDLKVGKPSDVTVFHDVHTIDFSLPQMMGMTGIMKVNRLGDGFETPRPFVEYAVSQGVRTTEDFRELL